MSRIVLLQLLGPMWVSWMAVLPSDRPADRNTTTLAAARASAYESTAARRNWWSYVLFIIMNVYLLASLVLQVCVLIASDLFPGSYFVWNSYSKGNRQDYGVGCYLISNVYNLGGYCLYSKFLNHSVWAVWPTMTSYFEQMSFRQNEQHHVVCHFEQ